MPCVSFMQFKTAAPPDLQITRLCHYRGSTNILLLFVVQITTKVIMTILPALRGKIKKPHRFLP